MSTVNVPRTTFNITSVPSVVENAPQRVLFVGQKTAAGSADEGLIRNIGVAKEWDMLFGSRSMLATGIRAFRKINDLSEVDAIVLEDAGTTTAASASIVFTGTATESSVFEFSIQSRVLGNFRINVLVGTTNDELAQLCHDAISARSDLIVGSAVATDTVSLSCTHGGTVGNDLALVVEKGLPAGITVVLTPFVGGTGDPVVSTVFDPVSEIRYQRIVYPSNYDLSVLKTFMDSRINVPDRLLDGIAMLCATKDTPTEFKSIASTLSSKVIGVLPNKRFDLDTFKGGGLGEFDYVVQSRHTAIRTLTLTEGAPISQYVVGTTANALSTGGAVFSVIPFHNTPIPDMAVGLTQHWFTDAEQSDLNNNGVSMIGNNPEETQVILGEQVTTDITDIADTAFKFMNAIEASIEVREFFFTNNINRYSQAILTEGDIIGGLPMADVQAIRAFQSVLYTDLSDLGITPKGRDAEKFFKAFLFVIIDIESGTVTIDMQKFPLNGAIRVINGTIRITFKGIG